MPELQRFTFNPAYAGLESTFDATFWLRNQWNGVEGKPENFGLSWHMPVYAMHGGVGMQLAQERIGNWKSYELEMAYSFVHVGRRNLWSFGLAAAWRQHELDWESVRTPEGIYNPFLTHLDPLLESEDIRTQAFMLHFGTYYVRDGWELGLSLRNVELAYLAKAGDAAVDWSALMQGQFSIEYSWDINQTWMLVPSAFVQWDARHLQMMLKVGIDYRSIARFDLGWRGFGNKNLDAILLNLRIKVDKHWIIGYAYDAGIGGLANRSNGSHSLILNYNLGRALKFNFEKKPPVIFNPRWLD